MDFFWLNIVLYHQIVVRVWSMQYFQNLKSSIVVINGRTNMLISQSQGR